MAAPQKICNRLRPGTFTRILESEEKRPSAGALVRLQLEEIFAIHKHLAARHLVIGVSAITLARVLFAGAIRAHNGMQSRPSPTERPEIADDLVLRPMTTT